jgi:hypothetical protein
MTVIIQIFNGKQTILKISKNIAVEDAPSNTN